MDAVTSIRRYLKSFLKNGILFLTNKYLDIKGYKDENWASNVSNRKSILGYFTCIGGMKE